jgi:hypothetical protein
MLALRQLSVTLDDRTCGYQLGSVQSTSVGDSPLVPLRVSGSWHLCTSVACCLTGESVFLMLFGDWPLNCPSHDAAWAPVELTEHSHPVTSLVQSACQNSPHNIPYITARSRPKHNNHSQPCNKQLFAHIASNSRLVQHGMCPGSATSAAPHRPLGRRYWCLRSAAANHLRRLTPYPRNKSPTSRRLSLSS